MSTRRLLEEKIKNVINIFIHNILSLKLRRGKPTYSHARIIDQCPLTPIKVKKLWTWFKTFLIIYFCFHWKKKLVLHKTFCLLRELYLNKTFWTSMYGNKKKCILWKMLININIIKSNIRSNIQLYNIILL